MLDNEQFAQKAIELRDALAAAKQAFADAADALDAAEVLTSDYDLKEYKRDKAHDDVKAIRVAILQLFSAYN